MQFPIQILLMLSIVGLLTVSLWRWLAWGSLGFTSHSQGTPACFRVAGERFQFAPNSPILLALIWVLLQVLPQLGKLFSGSAGEIGPVDPELSTVFLVAVLLPIFVTLLLFVLWERATDLATLARRILPTSWLRELLSGLDLFAIAFAPTALLLILSLLWKTPENQHQLLRLLQESDDPRLMIVVAVAAILVAPIFEELLFRVLLLSGLLKLMGRTRLSESKQKFLAVFGISILFCIGHGIHDALQLMPLALCLGWSYVQRQSYWTVVFAHASFNMFMLVMLLLSPTESMQ